MSFLDLHTNLHHQETRTSKNLEPWGFALGCQSVDPASHVAGDPVEDPCHMFTSLQAFRGIFNTRKLQHRLQPSSLETVSVAKLLHFGVFGHQDDLHDADLVDALPVVPGGVFAGLKH